MILSNPLVCQEITDIAVQASEEAAIAASKLIGTGKKNEADALAVNAMREIFNKSQYGIQVVIGEGEMDKAPMLYIGEKLGINKEKIVFDLAVDPLEGTNLCANNMPNSITAIAISDKGNLLAAPDCYMQKIASGKVFEKGVIHIESSIKENLNNLSLYLKKDITDLNVVILDRERHFDKIKEVRNLGAKVSLISDGDIYGIIATTHFGNGADLYLGSGGAPEGVLAAVAIKAVGGQMMGKLELESETQKQRAINYGIKNPSSILDLEDMVKGNAIFIASGITNGEMLKGIKVCKKTGNTICETIVFNAISNFFSVKKITHYLK
jgi:fructose-1,6-bisphosphatase class II